MAPTGEHGQSRSRQWSVIKGERIPGSTLPGYDLLEKPTQGTGQGQISDAALFAKALLEWNKMNLRALGLIQGKLNAVLWHDYIDIGDAAAFWTQQKFQENYQHVLSNGHSNIAEDLVVFMFCSTLPDSYQDTSHQYLNNIDDITKYKFQPIIDQVIQEESRRKA